MRLWVGGSEWELQFDSDVHDLSASCRCWRSMSLCDEPDVSLWAILQLMIIGCGRQVCQGVSLLSIQPHTTYAQMNKDYSIHVKDVHFKLQVTSSPAVTRWSNNHIGSKCYSTASLVDSISIMQGINVSAADICVGTKKYLIGDTSLSQYYFC